MANTQRFTPILVVLAATTLMSGQAPHSAANAPQPVLVELFTSQGCSSCPPADRLLSALGEAKVAAEAEIVPLAFHVDYWNRLGWTDPFSESQWSQRQQRYASALQSTTVYTPQLVIAGAAHVVGSDLSSVLNAIEEATKRQRGGSVAIVSAERTAQRLRADIASEVTRAQPLDLFLAVFENGLSTEVPSGENSGHTLHNDYVVRDLRHVGSTPGETNRTFKVEVALDPGWHELGLVAFLQDPKTLRIDSVAHRSPPSLSPPTGSTP